MSKVFLGVGHGGSDPGAVGYIKEADVNLSMALACRDYLVANGVEVKMSRITDENDTLNEEANECNAYGPDLAIDVHNNAGGGDGFEAYYSVHGGVGKTLAENIEAEVKAIGQNSRGCKTKWNSKGNADYYGFIRQTKCPAVIVEGVFVDNAADAAQADTIEEQKAFGEAYAKGILKTLGITPNNNSNADGSVSNPPSQPTGYLVKVTCDVLNVRNQPNASSKINTTVKKGEVYTIVEENNGWGKLKSGAGWIKLSYTTKMSGNSTTTSKPAAQKFIKVGQKAKLKTTAQKYCTGQTIPDRFKGKSYTVGQIGTNKYPDGILLKELYSWVKVSDLEY